MEKTSYSLNYPTGFPPPVLSVITTRTYQAKGPLSFFTDFEGRAGWYMDYDGELHTRSPVCFTVEEMLEKGWIEEVTE